MFESREIDSVSIRAQLADKCGRLPLIGRVVEHLVSGKGSLRAWVPTDSNSTRLNELRWGGISPTLVQQAMAQRELCAVAREFLRRTPGGLILIESPIASAGDEWVPRNGGETLAVGEVLHFVLRSGEPDDHTLIQRLYVGQGWYEWWVMCRSQDALVALERGATQRDALDEVIAASEEVWFGAYDGDGFIVWSPGGEPVARPV